MLDRYEKFTFLIEEVGKLLHKISTDKMEELGLKGSHALYLIMIEEGEGGITSAALSERCGRDKADVSRAINTMEKKGLVKKISVSGTNYRAPIVLTESGRRAAERLHVIAKSAVIYASQNVSEEDRHRFYETLEAIYANLCTMSKSGIPTENE